MVYLKQIKLINPDEVSGPVEDLKYPYKAAAVRYMDELVFTRPVTFLVGENGIGKSTLLEAVMYKYERRNEDLQGMLNDGDESHKVLANVLPDQIRLVEIRKPDDYFFFRAESFFDHAREIDAQSMRDILKYGRDYSMARYGDGVCWSSRTVKVSSAHSSTTENGTCSISSTNRKQPFPPAPTVIARTDKRIGGPGMPTHHLHPFADTDAYPEADIYNIDEDGARLTPFEETEHYQLTKYFLTHTQQMLRELGIG